MTMDRGTLAGHLMQRGVDPKNINVIIDEESGMATFLLYNLSGQIVGYQRYNPKGSKALRGRQGEGSDEMKYFTYIGDAPIKKKIAVWGVESLDDRPYVFITEGIFDAVKIRNAGQPAIAVLANDPKPLRGWFRMLGKKVIAMLDRDDAGGKLRNIADEHHIVPAPYKDLGDMPQDEASHLIGSIIHRNMDESKVRISLGNLKALINEAPGGPVRRQRPTGKLHGTRHGMKIRVGERTFIFDTKNDDEYVMMYDAVADLPVARISKQSAGRVFGQSWMNPDREGRESYVLQYWSMKDDEWKTWNDQAREKAILDQNFLYRLGKG